MFPVHKINHCLQYFPWYTVYLSFLLNNWTCRIQTNYIFVTPVFAMPWDHSRPSVFLGRGQRKESMWGLGQAGLAVSLLILMVGPPMEVGQEHRFMYRVTLAQPITKLFSDHYSNLSITSLVHSPFSGVWPHNVTHRQACKALIFDQ